MKFDFKEHLGPFVLFSADVFLTTHATWGTFSSIECHEVLFERENHSRDCADGKIL